jgi:hypothetical protein
MSTNIIFTESSPLMSTKIIFTESSPLMSTNIIFTESSPLMSTKIIFTESSPLTWLDGSIEDDEVELSGYSIHRVDRNSGGVCVY